MELPYQMYDADNHLYEPVDAFTRHLPRSRQRDLFWVTDERGRRHLILDGQQWTYIPNPSFDPISVAGSLEAMFAGDTSKERVQLDGFRVVEPLALHPEYVERDRRIERLDEQGVEATVLFPTLASGVEEYTRENVPLQRDLLRSFNRWLLDDWGFDHAGRIFATPMMSLSDPDDAVAELDWALANGCRAIDMRPAPILTDVGMKSPADPLFDPFWARCAEAGVLVCVHLGESGYWRYSADYTGIKGRTYGVKTGFEHVYLHGRPIGDFLTAMLCQGACARHPRLRLVCVENGSDWVPDLVRRFATYYQRYPGSFPEDPVEAFERNVWISPYWEDPIPALLQHLPLEHVLAGSDFPHPEGLAEPTDFLKGLDDLSDDDQRLVMRDNLRGLLA